jgi:probable O-glycosylation ligase (exosortase A-associated)
MGLTIVSILISYSRGALVGLTLTLAYFWLKSRHRVTVMLITGGVLLAALPLLPSAWFDRMNTIERYDEDASALGRFDAWLFAYRLALDHPFVGGGQLIGMDGNLFMKYVPTAAMNRAAHSIYFEVLGETGFVGLGLFLLLLATAGWTARNILFSTRDHPELAWARSLAAMIQVSLVGYAVTGAFLSLGFFDLFYALIAVLAVTQAVVRQELASRVGERQNQLTLTSTELTRPSPA